MTKNGLAHEIPDSPGPVAELVICLYDNIGSQWPGASTKYSSSSINAGSSDSSTRRCCNYS